MSDQSIQTAAREDQITDSIEARERAALANEAWIELTSVLQLMKEVDDHHQVAIRGMAMRCSDLSDIMGLALDPEVMKVSEAWEVLYGLGCEEKRVECLRRMQRQTESRGKAAA